MTPPHPRWSLTLYVSGASPRSAQALETVRRLGDEELPGQVELRLVGGAGSGPCQQGRERSGRGHVDQIGDVPAEERGAVGSDQLGQPEVGVQDDPALGDGDGAVTHLLDDHPVRPVGADQRVQLGTMGAAQHHGVDVPRADRGESFVQLDDLGAQPAEFVDVVLGWAGHCGAVPRSSPARSRSTSARSPTS